MNITNEERLLLYPDGSCPHCGARNWGSYLRTEDEAETGVYCLNCYAHFPNDPNLEYTH